MKKVITLVAALALTTPTLVVAQSQDQINADMLQRIQSEGGANTTQTARKSTAGPALGLTPGLIAAGIAITVVGIAAISGSSSASSTN